MSHPYELNLVEDTIAYGNVEKTERVWQLLESVQAQVSLVDRGRLSSELRQVVRQHPQPKVRKAFAKRTDLTEAERQQILQEETRSDVIAACLTDNMATELLQQAAAGGKASVIDRVARIAEQRSLIDYPDLADVIYRRIGTASAGVNWYPYSSIFNALASWDVKELARHDFPLTHTGLVEAVARNFNMWGDEGTIDRFLDQVLKPGLSVDLVRTSAAMLKSARVYLPMLALTSQHRDRVQAHWDEHFAHSQDFVSVTLNELLAEMDLCLTGAGSPDSQTIEQARNLGTLNEVLAYQWANGTTFDHLRGNATGDEIVQALDTMVKAHPTRGLELLTDVAESDIVTSVSYGENVWGYLLEAGRGLPGYHPLELLTVIHRLCPTDTFQRLIEGKIEPVTVWSIQSYSMNVADRFRTAPESVRWNTPMAAFAAYRGHSRSPSGLYAWLLDQAPQDPDAARLFLHTAHSLRPVWSGTLGQLVETAREVNPN